MICRIRAGWLPRFLQFDFVQLILDALQLILESLDAGLEGLEFVMLSGKIHGTFLVLQGSGEFDIKPASGISPARRRFDTYKTYATRFQNVSGSEANADLNEGIGVPLMPMKMR